MQLPKDIVNVSTALSACTYSYTSCAQQYLKCLRHSQNDIKIGLLNTSLKIAIISKTRKTKHYKAVMSKGIPLTFFSVSIPVFVEG